MNIKSVSVEPEPIIYVRFNITIRAGTLSPCAGKMRRSGHSAQLADATAHAYFHLTSSSFFRSYSRPRRESLHDIPAIIRHIIEGLQDERSPFSIPSLAITELSATANKIQSLIPDLT